MALTKNIADRHIRHALGGSPNAGVTQTEMINFAGQHLVSMHPWRWCEDAITHLDFRANITLTGGTWSNSADSLTFAANTLDDYVFIPGDTFEVTGGTGAYLGFYRIVSASAGNKLVLDRDITVQGTPQTENTAQSHAGMDTTSSDISGLVTGVVHAESCALPFDFAELTAYHSTSGLLKGFQMTSHADFLQKRSSSMITPGFHYATITQPAKLDGNGYEHSRPFPRLELWPAPNVNENAALQIVYRRGWADVDAADDVIPVPDWLNGLFLELCRAVALGWEEADIATVDQRLLLISQGPVFSSAVARDAAVQPDLGMIQGGAAEKANYSNSFVNSNAVNEPHSNVP